MIEQPSMYQDRRQYLDISNAKLKSVMYSMLIICDVGCFIALYTSAGVLCIFSLSYIDLFDTFFCLIYTVC